MKWTSQLALAAWLFCAVCTLGQDASSRPEEAVSLHPTASCAVEILSDGNGVDFGPYISTLSRRIKQNWNLRIPEKARAPQMKKGSVSVKFAIFKEGRVGGMKMVTQSGDVELDRAAWGGITASSPFPPLPSQFFGDYLELRLRFLYNPDTANLALTRSPAPLIFSCPVT